MLASVVKGLAGCSMRSSTRLVTPNAAAFFSSASSAVAEQTPIKRTKLKIPTKRYVAALWHTERRETHSVLCTMQCGVSAAAAQRRSGGAVAQDQGPGRVQAW